jgi:predicted RNA-binding Zn-ribbon protein involved in translation (DUF1610 family)
MWWILVCLLIAAGVVAFFVMRKPNSADKASARNMRCPNCNETISHTPRFLPKGMDLGMYDFPCPKCRNKIVVPYI